MGSSINIAALPCNEGDLMAVLGPVSTQGMYSDVYTDWERHIAEPRLRELGYHIIGWRTTDGDSFGPLVRGVLVRKGNGPLEILTYG